jgi:hypothetical protein
MMQLMFASIRRRFMRSRFGWLPWIALFLSPIIPAVAQTAPTITEKQLVFLENAARGRFSGRWIEANSNQLRSLRLKAEGYQAEIVKNHLVGGLIVSRRFTDTDQKQTVSYEALESSARLTGFYLTAMAYWFSVDLKPQALERIRDSLAGLQNIATVSGNPGYLAAFAANSSDPAYKAAYPSVGGADPDRPGFGRLAYPGSGGQVWIGGTSRETYSAVIMGLATVHKRIREPKIRQRASNLIDQIIVRLDKDDWRITDGRGHVDFVTPLLKAAILRAGASINSDRYGQRYVAAAKVAMEYPALAAPRYGDPRASMLNLANLVTLTSLETNETRSLGFQNRLTQVWRRNGSDLNPWIAMAYVNAFDRPPNDMLATATLQGVLQLYPPAPRWQHAAAPLASNHPVVLANGQAWSRDARLLHQRRSNPFAWEDSPRDLSPGVDAPITHSSVDYLTLFWMGRDSGIIPNEDSPRTESGPNRPRPESSRPKVPLPPGSTNRVSTRPPKP